MHLGNFSISLNVKDIAASRAFYETLGFSVYAGEQEHNWLILKNGDTIVGLFQGMLERNTLTFNPGWDSNAQPLKSFTDVRDIEQRLREAGIEIVAPVEAGTTGPGRCIVVDPDGNPILLDQHV